MKKLRFRRETLISTDDVQYIVSTMKEVGYEISPEDAKDAWYAASTDRHASWLLAPAYRPEAIATYILLYCDEVAQ